jgi:hypothetical protein
MRKLGVCTLVTVVSWRAACRRVGNRVSISLVIAYEDTCHLQTGKKHIEALTDKVTDSKTRLDCYGSVGPGNLKGGRVVDLLGKADFGQ